MSWTRRGFEVLRALKEMGGVLISRIRPMRGKAGSLVQTDRSIPLILILALLSVACYHFLEGRQTRQTKNTSFALPTPRIDLTSDLLRSYGSPYPHPTTYCKGIYITSWIAGTRRAEELIRMAERTELNAVVIDIKDSTGRVAYETQVPLAREIGASQGRISDIDGLLDRCHRGGIYTIARIVLFQDPHLAKARPEWAIKGPGEAIWRDRKGLSWMDPACKEVWNYNLELAKEAAHRGFDEIQFDYVRFPSDGKISLCTFPYWDQRTPKYEIIRGFLAWASAGLSPYRIPISVDFFGLTLWRDDDLNIGQRIIDAMYYVDYICPMVYPSHYPSHFMGFKNPADHPYEIVYQSLIRGQSILLQAGARAQLRPWLQDFDLGANYDRNKVILQKRAVYDAQSFGWVLWNPQNRYTEEALEADWMGRLTLQEGKKEGWIRGLSLKGAPQG